MLGINIVWWLYFFSFSSCYIFILVIVVCYFVIGLLLGMCGEEVVVFKCGCFRFMCDEYGKVKGYEFVGRIFKICKNVDGVEYCWIVIEFVVRVVLVVIWL